MELGLKVTVWPVPCPEADSVIAELKPPETAVVMVAVPDAFLATVSVVGEAEMVKLAAGGAVIVSETVVVCVSPPPVPVIVMLYVPVAALEATVNVAVEVPEPGEAMDAGLKPTVTPAGIPEAVRAMAELNAPEIAVLMVEVPLLPWTTETAVGEAEIVKAGIGVEDPVSAVISPAVGLPHPVTRS
jgi:hypothetical protein